MTNSNHNHCQHPHNCNEDPNTFTSENGIDFSPLWFLIPFLLILIVKFGSQHNVGFFMFIGMFVVSYYLNILTKEVEKGVFPKFIALITSAFTFLVIIIVHLRYSEVKLVKSLYLAPNVDSNTTWTVILWNVTLIDFSIIYFAYFLKIYTICFFSASLMRLYVLSSLERFFFIYRILLPIAPWSVLILFNSVHGYKILNYLLFGVYLVVKLIQVGKHVYEARNVLPILIKGLTLVRESNTAFSNCRLCFNSTSKTQYVLPCQHKFCDKCLLAWMHEFDICPKCKKKISDRFQAKFCDASTTIFPILC